MGGITYTSCRDADSGERDDVGEAYDTFYGNGFMGLEEYQFDVCTDIHRAAEAWIDIFQVVDGMEDPYWGSVAGAVTWNSAGSPTHGAFDPDYMSAGWVPAHEGAHAALEDPDNEVVDDWLDTCYGGSQN